MEITGASGSLEDYIPDGNFCATTKRRGSDENLPPLDQLASSAVGSKRTRKGGRCNLRKSLAWNPAFFTEEGVLDPSELSMISSSLTKTSGKAPPRINSEKSQVILYESYTGESQPNNLKENLSSNVQLRSISQNDGKKASKLSLSEESINNGPRMSTRKTPSMKVSSKNVPRLGIKYSRLEKAETTKLWIEKDPSKLRFNSFPSSSTKSHIETTSGSAGITSSNIQQTHKFCGLPPEPSQAKPSALRMPSPSFGFFQQKKAISFPSNEIQKASEKSISSGTSLRKPTNLKVIAPSRPPVIQTKQEAKQGIVPTKVNECSGKSRSRLICSTNNACNHPSADCGSCADSIRMKQADLKHKNYSIYSGSLNFQTDVTKRMSTKHLSIGHKIDEKTQNVHLMNTDTGIRKDEENGRKSHVGNKSATEKGGIVAMTDDCGRYNDGRGSANETSAYTCKDKHLCESSRLVSNTRHATKSTDTRHASESTVCVTQEAGLCTKPTEEETKVVGVYNTMEHFDGNGSRVQCVVQKNMTTKATIGKLVSKDDIQSCEFREESSSVKESELTPAKKDTGRVKPHLNAVPYSEEWLAAIEAFGEDILEIKTGTVQNSPTEKALPEPSPWSPVNKKAKDIGPFDCTKYNKKSLSDME